MIFLNRADILWGSTRRVSRVGKTYRSWHGWKRGGVIAKERDRAPIPSPQTHTIYIPLWEHQSIQLYYYEVTNNAAPQPHNPPPHPENI